MVSLVDYVAAFLCEHEIKCVNLCYDCLVWMIIEPPLWTLKKLHLCNICIFKSCFQIIIHVLILLVRF